MIKKALSISCLKKYIILLILGFAAGCILCSVFSNEIINSNKLVFTENIKSLQDSRVSSSDILYILIEKRLIVLVVLAAVGLSGAGKSIMSLFLLWFSGGSGMFVAALIRMSGIKALIVAICFFIPQYIIYVPAFGILFCQIHKFHSNFNWKKKEYKVRKKGIAATPVTEYIISLILLFIFVFVGILMEAYINPYLIKKIVTIL